jgi:carnitine 3-dehydrogenase
MCLNRLVEKARSRAAKEEPLMKGADFRKVAVLGSGVIGTGWATCFALHDREVTLYDVSQERLDLSQRDIGTNLSFLNEKGLLDEDKMRRASSLVTLTLSLGKAVQGAQLIQENVSESLEIKQALLGAVEDVADPAALFASSTSGIRITEIAAKARRPQRCIGAHPYNPAHLIPLVELTKGLRTDDDAIRTAREFYVSVGKEPIVLGREAVGFVGNRLQFALYREAVDLVMKGVCTVEDVDKACVFGPGLRWGIMGPNLIFHLAGGRSGIKTVLEHIGPSFERSWKDMADWKTWPSGWPEVAQEGVEREIANRPRELGNAAAEIARFRDDVLIQLLTLHGKLPARRGEHGGGT